MALLIFLDTGGPVIHLGDQAVVSDLAGLVLVEAVLAGDEADVDAIVSRHGGDRVALRALARLLADLGPITELEPIDEAAPIAVAPHPIAEYAPERLLQAQLPQPVLADSRGFRAWPAGSLVAVPLDAAEVALLGSFAMPNRGEALPVGGESGNPSLATAAARDRVLTRLCAEGLLTEQVSVPYRTTWDQGTASTMRVHHRTRALVRQQAALLEQRPPRAGRVPVFGVERGTSIGPPLALGLLFAAAEAHRDGALVAHYDFVPDWHVRPASVRRAVADGPAVFLFSNYVWSSSGNLAISAKVKEHSEHSLVVHGGPNTPKFPGDREQYFVDHPSVDVIVHGEGEVTLPEVLDALGGRLDGDLRVLADVPGITFRPRPGADPVTTAERERIVDLDAIPSPFLRGTFDAWKHAATMVTMETNRGCPYGCTFCDWGSATASRIRKFDLDRVFAELDWVAAAEVPIVMIADANFGIFERDVAIVERIAELKASTGFPDRLLTNYAKNTVKHLEPIVTILSDAHLDVNGVMSVQSFDENVLAITKRKNLKASEFERLATRFRANQMPMLTDLMIGLPGSTLETTRSDLQGVLEHEVNANIHPTQLLPNSPMNEPSYRAEWEIVTDENAILVSTRSYTVDDRAEMDRMVDAFHAADTFGVLRVVTRWLGYRVGEREIDVLEHLRIESAARPGTYPLLNHVLTRFLDSTTPPGPWPLLLDEVGRFIGERWGIAVDDPEWQAVRTLQVHVLPDHGRAFPESVALGHDVPTWLADLEASRKGGPRPDPLATYAPATVAIDDPHETCATLGTRHGVTDHHSFELAWSGARHITYRWTPD